MSLKQGKIIIISGPSGSGKTTLHRKLLASSRWKKKLVKSVSVTTRPKRPGEQDGRDYFFVSPRMFQYKQRRGHFLESEEVFGNYYGTPQKIIEGFLKSGKNVLICIDVQGAKTVRKKFSKAVMIFIKAPSVAVLAKRLRARGSEDQEVVQIRLKRAREEIRESRFYDYIVINDDLREAYQRLEEILEREIGG